MGLDRLLHELDVQAPVLHLVEQLDGLLGAPGLVGIDADANVVAYTSLRTAMRRTTSREGSAPTLIFRVS